MEQYRVNPVKDKIEGVFDFVPGSKSITNRALLICALAEGTSILSGTLFSDDSRHFLKALQDLGFEVRIEEEKKQVMVRGENGKIPNKTGKIYVGSAGTAARFLTAMCGLSDGVYEIQASSQMEKRPMKPLFEALEQLGADITYLKEPYFLPVMIEGAGKLQRGRKEVSLDISKSTQFLSAFLMTSVMCKEGLKLNITSEKKIGSYIKITMDMMKDFGVTAEFDGEQYVIEENASYQAKQYQIEPDVSAACYFWAMAALTNGCVTIKNIHKNSMQGDMMFLDVLEQMGCKVSDTREGVKVEGASRLKGVKVDMNNFSDQALTLAALAVFADGPTRMEHIGHIRLQESDRLKAIATELGRMGIKTEEEEDAITIYPGEVTPAVIKTYEDHRVAMAFSLVGLKKEGIIIEDPLCCKKTFEEYFLILDKLTK
ncbi:MAG: 3-phosphoshikimate 1-carboxyvinyltransferase [Lachnospiraceae bacterium]|nr:3-phosphoshikimate 1-carboxyvinyltransferase [Lachnospiraceae bacterium]